MKMDASFLFSRNTQWNHRLKSLPVVARSQATVLLLGNSGTGKELLARALHQLSPRRDRALVTINCGALSESLIESELFGHREGSFTGALKSRKGAFEEARGGTLFLDEIGELPLAVQPKLLRAIENSEIKPVGSDQNLKTDVRIIAATQPNLNEKLESGEFRTDLFYRLNVVNFSLPDLKDRPEDIPDLALGFAQEHGVKVLEDAMEYLKSHPWPGNIRELRNLIHRLSVLYPRRVIGAADLKEALPRNAPPSVSESPQEGLMKRMERELICKALVLSHGNQRRASEFLGLPKSTLNDRIRSHGISIMDLLK